MSEQLRHHGPEHLPHHEAHEARVKQEQLKETLEKQAEHAERTKESVETARSRVEQHALSGKEIQGKKTEQHADGYISKQDKARSFDQTMGRVRSHMSRPARAFSKLIHRPGVERVSEVAGKTVVRPSSVMGGGLAVFIGLGYILFVANRAGFALSGSEFAILLIAGWIVGLAAELLIKGMSKLVKR